MKILSLGRVHPWRHTRNWQPLVKNRPPVPVPVRGFEIICDWQDSFYLSLLFLGDFEKYESNILENIIRRGDMILDVGANVGYMTLLMALKSGPTGRVYSYEPVKRTFQKLQENIKHNEKLPLSEVILRRKGLGERAASIPIYLRAVVSGTGIDSGRSSIISDFSIAGYKVIAEQIELCRLDDENIEDKLTLVKCDIEGYEKAFFEGGMATLSRDKPLLLFEWNPSPQSYTAEDIIAILRGICDYEFFSISEKGLIQVSQDELKSQKFGNILCAIRKLHQDRLGGLLSS